MTGASGGLGSALVKKLVEGGHRVIAISRRGLEMDRVVNIRADVTREADVVRAMGEVKRAVGGLDGVACLAGHGDPKTWNKSLEELNPADFLDVFNVDVIGTFIVVKHALSLMRQGASIVLVSSSAALVGDIWGIPYATAKGGIISLGLSLAKALAPRVRVNVVAFGPMSTRWVNWMKSEELECIRSRTLLGRFGDPEEAANAIYFLLSPESSYITGHVLVVDGGEALGSGLGKCQEEQRGE